MVCHMSNCGTLRVGFYRQRFKNHTGLASSTNWTVDWTQVRSGQTSEPLSTENRLSLSKPLKNQFRTAKPLKPEAGQWIRAVYLLRFNSCALVLSMPPKPSLSTRHPSDVGQKNASLQPKYTNVSPNTKCSHEIGAILVKVCLPITCNVLNVVNERIKLKSNIHFFVI